MSEKKNLKGGSSKLLYYRSRPTGNRTPKTKIAHGKQIPYFEEELERIYFKEEDVQKFSLDRHGQNIPYVDGHLTIINNYMFDYWSHFLSAEGIALFGHLMRYCYGAKDICWPNLELIALKMNKSRNTVKKYLAILEDYGFVYHFNVQNADMNNTDESPLFKVRKKVPFLSQELYEQLPPVLQADHDRYLSHLLETCEKEDLELDPNVNYNDIYSELIEKGRIHRKPKQLSLFEAEKQTQIKKQLLQQDITEADKQLWSSFMEEVKTKIAKPSIDTWFKGTFATKQDGIYTIYTPHNHVTEWLESRYFTLITDTLRAVDTNFTGIRIESISR
ncbi:helix-turn-helix domain-containing protein [Paenibacillus alkaliterrae]|uniref:helix-turn-helix domain-containing protein n=1 Tax=Paenibacillus alkaliterrae TaxID=320909 RepID=UPI001F475EFD|nr:helix-turn-helix domain-containing protein [Paenibacillus alkaliterrae]MCF2940669.1 helix-turn-helix domain-containing protein [Paenibacillus alkaliterrae]